MASHARRAGAETLGSAFLLAAIVGSGIMAERLAGGNAALALLCNALATGALLTVLILLFAPVSGAHFNPAITLAFALRGDMPWSVVPLYLCSQIAGAILGVAAAHLMFELPLVQVATTVRPGVGRWIAEAIAAGGLTLTILGCLAAAPATTA
jgi:glycerol uptake facilitator-like aquaporin